MHSFINYSGTIQKMKKIKSIKQLRAEKQRLKEHQELLELKIRNNWTDLKESVSIGNIAKETFSKVIASRPVTMLAGSGLLKGALALGISLLATKVVDKGGQKLLGKLKLLKR